MKNMQLFVVHPVKKTLETIIIKSSPLRFEKKQSLFF